MFSFYLFVTFLICIHMHVDARTKDDILKKQFSGVPSCDLKMGK